MWIINTGLTVTKVVFEFILLRLNDFFRKLTVTKVVFEFLWNL